MHKSIRQFRAIRFIMFRVKLLSGTTQHGIQKRTRDSRLVDYENATKTRLKTQCKALNVEGTIFMQSEFWMWNGSTWEGYQTFSMAWSSALCL